VTADGLVHRADVQARAAPDAIQNFRQLRAEQAAPAVVDQHHVQLVGTIGFVCQAGAGQDVGVHGQQLAGRAPAQQLQHQTEIGERRNDPLDAHERHMDPRYGRRQPAVPFISGDADAASSRHAEVRAAHPHVGLQELGPQQTPGERRHVRNVRHVLGRRSKLPLEERRDIVLTLVEDGTDDVRWVLAGQLHDELAEIRFHDPDARGLESGVQFELLADHRLRLHSPPHAV
jgi:hypothetical protein